MVRTLTIASYTGEAESWMHTFVHTFLPSFALAAGLLAVIWLACAIIATAGAYIVGFAFLGTRRLIRTCFRAIRRRWNTEYAHLVTVNPDGVTTTSVNPRHARRWRTRPTTSDNSPDTGPDTP